MANDLRVVLDTGVVVSAMLLPRSVPRQALELAIERGRILVSEATIVELDDVVRRKKFDKYVTEESRLEFLAALVREAELVSIDGFYQTAEDMDAALRGGAAHIWLEAGRIMIAAQR